MSPKSHDSLLYNVSAALEGALSSLNKITEVTSTVCPARGLHTVHKAWTSSREWGIWKCQCLQRVGSIDNTPSNCILGRLVFKAFGAWITLVAYSHSTLHLIINPDVSTSQQISNEIKVLLFSKLSCLSLFKTGNPFKYV